MPGWGVGGAHSAGDGEDNTPSSEGRSPALLVCRNRVRVGECRKTNYTHCYAQEPVRTLCQRVKGNRKPLEERASEIRVSENDMHGLKRGGWGSALGLHAWESAEPVLYSTPFNSVFVILCCCIFFLFLAGCPRAAPHMVNFNKPVKEKDKEKENGKSTESLLR